jgi:hypothetical protein
MTTQGIVPITALSVGAAFVGLMLGGAAQAQLLPPMAGPVYESYGAYPPPPPPMIGGATIVYDDVLLPQEVAGILASTGYRPLGAPVRHGRFYVVRVLHPNGGDGRVTLDAMTGRLVRFVPAGQSPQGGVVASAFPPPPRGLRPPMPLTRQGPVPASKPAFASRSAAPSATPPAATTPATPAATTTAAASPPPATQAPSPKPADQKPVVQLQPTQPMPPVQSLE